jgi:hypothetical protein
MSESVRWNEIRVRQEIYKELLKQKASCNGGDSDGAEGIGWDEAVLEVSEFETR